MDEQKQVEAARRELERQIKEFKKLQRISNSKEFSDFFDLLLKTAAEKMVWAFTAGKDGDNIKNWDDFCKVRGEIVARLQPIQEIRGAETMVKYIEQQLNTYYKQPV